MTGGAGFLGRALVQRLGTEGWDVTAVDVRPGPRVISGDITRAGAWTSHLAGADLVVHAAALVGDTGDERSHWDVNVGGTRTVAEACLAAGVGHLMHLSSLAVLGSDFPDGAAEDHAVRMTGNPFTDTSIAAEHQALRVAAKGLRLTIVRPSEVYGPHSTQWTVRPVTLIGKGLFVLVDGGEGTLSPLYVDDAIEGIIRAATCPGARGEVLHLTGAEGVSVADFFGCYAEMLGRSIPSLPRLAARSLTAGAEKVMRPLGLAPPFSSRALEYVTHPGTYGMDRTAEVLGWRPRIALEQGMAATETWLRDVGLIERL